MRPVAAMQKCGDCHAFLDEYGECSNNCHIKVQSGIPIPTVSYPSRQVTYPFNQMRKGDSFFVRIPQGVNPESIRSKVLQKAVRVGFPKGTFTTRQVVEEGVHGLRIWMVKPTPVIPAKR